MSNENLPAASVAPVLPAHYRELYEAMESVMRNRNFDIPESLKYMSVYPDSIVEQILYQRDPRNRTREPNLEDVRTFVAFMRDGICTRGGQP